MHCDSEPHHYLTCVWKLLEMQDFSSTVFHNLVQDETKLTPQTVREMMRCSNTELFLRTLTSGLLSDPGVMKIMRLCCMVCILFFSFFYGLPKTFKARLALQ